MERGRKIEGERWRGREEERDREKRGKEEDREKRGIEREREREEEEGIEREG